MTVLTVIDSDAVAIGKTYKRACESLIGSALYAKECGSQLIAKKSETSAWGKWLHDNEATLGFGERTAQRFIRFAVEFPTLTSDSPPELLLAALRKLWGNAAPQLAAEVEAYQAEIEAGCTVEDLNVLAASGKKFGAILADPPWQFKVYSGKGKSRSADRRYDTSPLEAIQDLPVEQLAADDCALFLWCVSPELPGALEVIKSWGFTYKTVGFAWVKQTKGDNGLHWGMGYWTRANLELCLFATRGAPKRINKDVHQVIQCPVMEHSRKPEETHVRIERLVPGPYLELYGRRPMRGWTVWGNQIERNLLTREIQEFAA